MELSDALKKELDSHVNQIVSARLTSNDFGFSIIWYEKNHYQLSTRPYDATCSNCNEQRRIRMRFIGDQYPTLEGRKHYAQAIFSYLEQRIEREPVDTFCLVGD